MDNKLIPIFICFLVFFISSSCGCIDDSNNKVTFNLLYSSPVKVNNTTVYLDNAILMQFTNVEVDIYPPHVGEKTKTLESGKYDLWVVDTNFNLTKSKTIDVKKRMYIDIIISDDEISISASSEPTGYK